MLVNYAWWNGRKCPLFLALISTTAQNSCQPIAVWIQCSQCVPWGKRGLSYDELSLLCESKVSPAGLGGHSQPETFSSFITAVVHVLCPAASFTPRKFHMIVRIGPTSVVVVSCTSDSAWEHRCPGLLWAGICMQGSLLESCCGLRAFLLVQSLFEFLWFDWKKKRAAAIHGSMWLVEDALQRSSGTFSVSTAWMMRSLGHPRCFRTPGTGATSNIFKRTHHVHSCFSFLTQKSSKNPTLGKYGNSGMPDLHFIQEIRTQCGTTPTILNSDTYSDRMICNQDPKVSLRLRILWYRTTSPFESP